MTQREISPTSFADEEIITMSPEIMSGTPVFAGTRVPVRSLFDHLAAGDSLEVFFEDFPAVSFEQVSALLKRIGEEIDGRRA